MTPQELLPLYALGALEPEEAALVERAIAEDPKLRVQLDAFLEAAGIMPAALPGMAPPPSLRDRLFANLDAMSQPGRWERFAGRLAEMYDVTVEKARMFLSWIDEPSRWGPSAFPNVQLIHLPPGPKWATADCGIVRMPAGFHFPNHGHHGPELTFVLQGKAHESNGTVLEPGMEQELGAGVEHDFVIDEASGDYIFAVRFYGIFGIQLEAT